MKANQVIKSTALFLFTATLFAAVHSDVAQAAVKVGSCKLSFGSLTGNDNKQGSFPINTVPPEVEAALTKKGYDIVGKYKGDLVLFLDSNWKWDAEKGRGTVTTAILKKGGTSYSETAAEGKGVFVTSADGNWAAGNFIDANSAVEALPSCEK